MPKDSLQITVFLASPGDVNRERKAVRDAVAEINVSSGEAEGFHLVVKSWETHSRPGAGRPQGVINEQIGPTDIFVGIMWARLGTPSGKAKSGTVEEYERARQRHTRSRAKRKPSVMFYFRTSSPRRLRDLDPAQLQAVREFKTRVFKNNLAREYETVKEFEGLIRVHLLAEARAIVRARRGASRQRPKKKAATPKRKTPAKRAPSKKATPKPSPKKKRMATRRKPPLNVPKVPKTITDADRRAFVEKALRSVRARFEKTAAAFNRSHPHARITLKREGGAAFTAEAVVEGESKSLARISIGTEDWSRRPSLEYERGSQFSFYGGEPSYRAEQTVRVEEKDGALGFESASPYGWDASGALNQAKDVAEAFWDRFTQPFS